MHFTGEGLLGFIVVQQGFTLFIVWAAWMMGRER